jgi:hypothetical protein
MTATITYTDGLTLPVNVVVRGGFRRLGGRIRPRRRVLRRVALRCGSSRVLVVVGQGRCPGVSLGRGGP